MIDQSGVGGVRLGTNVTDVSKRCKLILDTLRLTSDHSDKERAALFSIGGDTVEAIIAKDGRVARVDINGRGPATRDSLRVGSALSALIAHGADEAEVGEEGVIVKLRQQCGVGFMLAGARGYETGATLTSAQIRQLPSTLLVQKILIIGCSK